MSGGGASVVGVGTVTGTATPASGPSSDESWVSRNAAIITATATRARAPVVATRRRLAASSARGRWRSAS